MKILNKNKVVLIVLLLSSLTLVSNLFAQQTQNSGFASTFSGRYLVHGI